MSYFLYRTVTSYLGNLLTWRQLFRAMFRPFSIQIDWSVTSRIVALLVGAIDALSAYVLFNERTLRRNFKVHNMMCMFIDKPGMFGAETSYWCSVPSSLLILTPGRNLKLLSCQESNLGPLLARQWLCAARAVIFSFYSYFYSFLSSLFFYA